MHRKGKGAGQKLAIRESLGRFFLRFLSLSVQYLILGSSQNSEMSKLMIKHLNTFGCLLFF